MSVQLVKRILRPAYAPLVRRFRRRHYLRHEQVRIRDEVRRAVQGGSAVRVIIGAGQTRFEGWIATDVPAFDLRNSAHWQEFFPPASIDRMLAEHVFEHLTTDELARFLEIAGKYLTRDGRARIAVPDGYHSNASYISSVQPCGDGIGAADHKVLYTSDLMSDLMQKQGYEFELLEYFDGAGQFHQNAWSAADGFVGRSADFDARNTGGQLNYTSLIVDCWPRSSCR